MSFVYLYSVSLHVRCSVTCAIRDHVPLKNIFLEKSSRVHKLKKLRPKHRKTRSTDTYQGIKLQRIFLRLVSAAYKKSTRGLLETSTHFRFIYRQNHVQPDSTIPVGSRHVICDRSERKVSGSRATVNPRSSRVDLLTAHAYLSSKLCELYHIPERNPAFACTYYVCIRSAQCTRVVSQFHRGRANRGSQTSPPPFRAILSQEKRRPLDGSVGP